MTILNLFSTPIYVNKLEHDSLIKNQKEIDSAVNIIKSKDGFTSSVSIDPFNTKINDTISYSKFLETYNCSELIKIIINNTNQYMNNIGIFDAVKLEITNSWMTCSPKGYHTQVHHHESCDISGIYYYNTNGTDGNLYFRSPTKYMEISKIFRNSSKQDFEITPVIGMLILFPSWLDHGVRTNTNDTERMSISFNMKSI